MVIGKDLSSEKRLLRKSVVMDFTVVASAHNL